MSEETQNNIWKVGNRLRITTVYEFDEESGQHTYEGEVIWRSNGYGFKCVYGGKEIVFVCQGSYWFGSISSEKIEVIEYAKPVPVKPVENKEDKYIMAYGLKTKTWGLHENYGYGCAECCNGDCDCEGEERCRLRGRRKNCPHCKGEGWILKQDAEEFITHVNPVDNGITVLINKINERIRLIPDEPNLSQRGALDAYLNVISWANDKAIENTTLNTPIQSGVEEAAKEYCKDIKHPYNFNLHQQREECFKAGGEWQAQQVKQPVMQWVKASERLPLYGVMYALKNINDGDIGVGYFNENEKEFVCWYPEKKIEDISEIEWLEEPPIQ